jgi:hypothetical protein
MKRLLGRSDHDALTMLRDRMWQVIAANPAIRTIEP